jgi:hypothetical protein
MKNLTLILLVASSLALMGGCGESQADKDLETKAPPVSNPKKEATSPGVKKTIPTPPTMGAPSDNPRK